VAHILQFFELPIHNRVANMKIFARWIYPVLNSQFLATIKFLAQILFDNDLFDTICEEFVYLLLSSHNEMLIVLYST